MAGVFSDTTTRYVKSRGGWSYRRARDRALASLPLPSRLGRGAE